VLITGTSIKGLGFETARAIAKHANLVIITGYNAERYAAYFIAFFISFTQSRLKLSEDAIKKEIPSANIRPLVLDLSSMAAIRAAAAEVNAYPEPLHVCLTLSLTHQCKQPDDTPRSSSIAPLRSSGPSSYPSTGWNPR
jgi:NAD(P)-dependent dehydrogenase (short-subunit alcohol dehydrogenase family)